MDKPHAAMFFLIAMLFSSTGDVQIPKKGEEGHLCKKNLRTEEGIFEHIKTHIGLVSN